MSNGDMDNDKLERLLADSFDRQARSAVPDGARPPRPRFADPTATPAPRRMGRILAPLAAAAAVVAIVSGALVLGHDSTPSPHTTAAIRQPALTASPTTPTTAQSTVTGPHVGVHVALLNSDASEVGVGMPVIAYFSKVITDARPFAAATTLTVNGKPATGAWFFEKSANRKGYPLEAHFRMDRYWPANAKISVALPVQGLSGGGDYAFDDSLTLAFATGPAQVVTVDDVAHRLSVTRDGAPVLSARVSLGAAQSPTTRGIKVIMEKGADISMVGPGYSDPHVHYTQRLTYSGEFLHAAPWNKINIDKGVDSSNGCTNLMPSDAKKLYSLLRVGDVVKYPNATGAEMTLSEGYGDWNVPWSQWLSGGAVRTS